MENTKNHGSQGHTKESANDSKKTANQGQGKTGSHNAANASGTKVNKNDDDSSSSNSKSGSKSNGSH